MTTVQQMSDKWTSDVN